MADRSVKSTAVTNATLVTTAETVVCVLVIPSDNTPDQQVELSGTVDMVGGAGVTSATLRIRRGNGVAGAIVGAGETIAVAGITTVQAGVEAIDTPGLEAGQQYSLTVQQIAATGNGTVNQASLEAILP